MNTLTTNPEAVVSEDLMMLVAGGVALTMLWFGLFAVTLPRPESGRREGRGDEITEEETRRMIERMRENLRKSRRDGPGGR